MVTISMSFEPFSFGVQYNTFDYLTEKGLNDIVDFFRNKCNMLNSTIGNPTQCRDEVNGA